LSFRAAAEAAFSTPSHYSGLAEGGAAPRDAAQDSDAVSLDLPR
jgi:hypothetical protein